MTHRLGVDIGGIFTDFALSNEDSGQLVVHKQLATPDDPSRVVLDGIYDLLENERVDIGSIKAIVHGTMLVTNAIIERKGAKSSVITTAGFAGALDMKEGRERLRSLRSTVGVSRSADPALASRGSTRAIPLRRHRGNFAG
jgi:N-methylhydantoinase A/oxoprolinase/acetone carboxylase beta subunit